MFFKRKPPRILVLSGSSVIRYPSVLNHKIYCEFHGYEYRFDNVPERGLANLYLHKLATIQRHLPEADWLFWLDDDAFFRQLNVNLESIVEDVLDENDLIFCKSPINNGNWTYLSAGNFFIRNCWKNVDLLKRCMSTPLAEVRTWWDEDLYGKFFGGDQELLIYQIAKTPALERRCVRLPFERFNCRPFHFSTASEHFLVHFTHRADVTKEEQMKEFSCRFDLHASLVEKSRIEGYELYAAQLHWPEA